MFSGLEASLVRVRRVRVWEGLESEEGEEEEDGGDDELPCSILMLVPSDGGGGWDEDERMARALLPLRSACFRFPGIM